jgi:mono/diheme cytochrome c family protein
MQKRQVIEWAISLLLLGSLAGAQEAQKPTIKHVPIRQTAAYSGPEMYKNYCAVCHGEAMKGDGPAASALKTIPPDLTTLAQRNDGKYPSAKVASAIRGDVSVASHGSHDMPVWGPLFSSMAAGHAAEVQQRIANLNKYIESKQLK